MRSPPPHFLLFQFRKTNFSQLLSHVGAFPLQISLHFNFICTAPNLLIVRQRRYNNYRENKETNWRLKNTQQGATGESHETNHREKLNRELGTVKIKEEMTSGAVQCSAELNSQHLNLGTVTSLKSSCCGYIENKNNLKYFGCHLMEIWFRNMNICIHCWAASSQEHRHQEMSGCIKHPETVAVLPQQKIRR